VTDVIHRGDLAAAWEQTDAATRLEWAQKWVALLPEHELVAPSLQSQGDSGVAASLAKWGPEGHLLWYAFAASQVARIRTLNGGLLSLEPENWRPLRSSTSSRSSDTVVVTFLCDVSFAEDLEEDDLPQVDVTLRRAELTQEWRVASISRVRMAKRVAEAWLAKAEAEYRALTEEEPRSD
jgi:hypothetical protein